MSRRHLFLVAAGAVACVGVCLGAPGRAEAFVRYHTTIQQPYSWRTKTVKLTGYPRGLSSMTLGQITDAMTASVGAWSKEDPTNGLCSYLDLALTMASPDEVPPDAANDFMNIIAIRNGDWQAICSTTKEGKVVCHQPGELALTTVWSRACGEIVEADVEVNAGSRSGFTWADLLVSPSGQAHDLQNALTHEMGHFIGLDHTCALGGLYPLDKNGVPVIPVDNLGRNVPACEDQAVTMAEREATMFPSANPGDVDKRSLSLDDQAGLCAIYPINTNPRACGSSQTEGCSIANGPAEDTVPTRHGWGWLLLALSGLGGAWLVRARRTRRTR